MLKWIDKAKRGNERPEAFLQTSKEYFVYKYYQVALKRANAVDFDDLLLLVSDLMKRDMRIRGRLQAMHRYVLVDEYQDCSPAQVGEEIEHGNKSKIGPRQNKLHYSHVCASCKLITVWFNYFVDI